MALNGNEIIVYVQSGQSWTAVAAAKSDELQGECDLIEKASATQQGWREYVAGRKGWSLNLSWLVVAVVDIKAVLQVGTRVKIRIGGRTFYSSTGLEGYAIVKMCKTNHTRGNLANGTFQFVGDGPLT
jgi:predicted secreted protein